MRESKKLKEIKQPIAYFGVLFAIVILIIFTSILFLMISSGSLVAGDLVTKFAENDNPYELILNEEIFTQLDENSVNERINNVPIPRVIKLLIEEILAYYNIKTEVTDYETGDKVMMWDYVKALQFVRPMVMYIKLMDKNEIEVEKEGELMEELLVIPAVEQIIKNLAKVEEVTEEDIQQIIYRRITDYKFYLPGSTGALSRVGSFVKLEDGSYVENSSFYYNFYDMKRRTLDVNHYYQVGQPYSSHPFPSNDNCDDPTASTHATIAGSACGPMSFAMVVSYYHKKYGAGKFPNGIIQASPKLVEEGYYLAEVEEVVYDFCAVHPKGAGTSMFDAASNPELLGMYGVRFFGARGSAIPDEGVKSLSEIVTMANWIYEQIYQDRPIIIVAYGADKVEKWKNKPEAKAAFTMYLDGNKGFTSGGHYLVINGFDINGNFILSDPARRWSDPYPWKPAINQISYGFAFAPLGGGSSGLNTIHIIDDFSGEDATINVPDANTTISIDEFQNQEETIITEDVDPSTNIDENSGETEE